MKFIDHVVGLLVIATVIFVRILTPANLTGDLLLVTLLVFAWFVDGVVLATMLGATLLWLSLFPGMPVAIFLTILFPVAVFATHKTRILGKWRPWLLNVFFAVAATLLFHTIIQPSVFMNAPWRLVQGTAYALLYSAVLFGILRELYVRKER